MLPRLGYPLDFDPLLIFHVGTCNAAGSNLECIEDDYNWEEGKDKWDRSCLSDPDQETGKGLSGLNVTVCHSLAAWLVSQTSLWLL